MSGRSAGSQCASPGALPEGHLLASFETAGRTVTLVRGDVGRYAVVVERSEYAGGPANMSNDRAYACLAAATVGPDDFNVQLEGPALVPVVMKHTMRASTWGEFSVPVDGEYYLKVELLHERWAAVSEHDHECSILRTPLTQNATIVLKRAPAGLAQFAVSYVAPRGSWLAVDDAWQLVAPWETSSELLFGTPTSCANSQNLCDMPANVTYQVNVAVGPVTRHNLPLSVAYYAWQPRSDSKAAGGGTSFFWTAPTRTIWDRANMPTQTRIELAGDSHMRALFNGLLTDLCGSDERILKCQGRHCHLASTCKDLPPTSNCPGLTACFRWAPRCEYVAARDANDVFVSGCGAHFASGTHNTMAAYAQAVNAHLTNIVRLGHSRASYAWLEVISRPLRNDSFVLMSHDWQSTARVFLQNTLANNIVAKHQFRVIEAFEPMLALYDKLITDLAHFDNQGAQAPQLGSILQLLLERCGNVTAAVPPPAAAAATPERDSIVAVLWASHRDVATPRVVAAFNAHLAVPMTVAGAILAHFVCVPSHSRDEAAWMQLEGDVIFTPTADDDCCAEQFGRLQACYTLSRKAKVAGQTSLNYSHFIRMRADLEFFAPVDWAALRDLDAVSLRARSYFAGARRVPLQRAASSFPNCALKHVNRTTLRTALAARGIPACVLFDDQVAVVPRRFADAYFVVHNDFIASPAELKAQFWSQWVENAVASYGPGVASPAVTFDVCQGVNRFPPKADGVSDEAYMNRLWRDIGIVGPSNTSAHYGVPERIITFRLVTRGVPFHLATLPAVLSGREQALLPGAPPLRCY